MGRVLNAAALTYVAAAVTKRQPEHALSTAFVRTVAAAGRYCDGQGLYLDVQPSGSRSWVQRIAIRGRRRELGLGGFPLVSLKEARALAFANRKLARAGGDRSPRSAVSSARRPSPPPPNRSGPRCSPAGAIRSTARIGCRA